MTKIVKKVVIVIILISIFCVGYYVYNNYFIKHYNTYNAIKDNYKEKINVKGTIDIVNSAEVHSKSANMIKEILVKEGDIVKKDDILAYLDDNKIHEYEKAKLNYEEAKRNFDIAYNLYKSGDVSKDNYMKAKNAMDLAQVAIDSLEVEGDLMVKSPIDGVVTKIDAKIGMVAGGLMPHRLFHIDDINNLQIKVDIKEKDLYKIKIGQIASITSDAMGERVFYGKVSYVSSVGEASANNNTKKVIKVFIDINQNEKNITAGVSAKADIIVNEYKDVLIIPIECLIEEVDVSYINILKDNKKEKIKIKPLVVGDDEFIIKDEGVISIEDKILEVE